MIADYRRRLADAVQLSTQVPHFVRLFMALLLGLPRTMCRVIAPDVGGGFGQKLQVYGEELTACWASRKLGVPVKWIETRTENMSVAHQGRDQISHVRMGAKRDGTITAWHVKILADFGAYNMILTPLIPSLGAFVMGGCYDIPNVRTDIVGVFTNKCPTDAIRGAGRPEATQMIEVTVDQLAHELGIDPLEVRRRNFIPKERFPAAVATGVVYDSGNYHGTLDKLLEHVDVDAFRAEQAELREQGIYRGHRVLHLDRDLRAGAIADHRPGRRRRAGRSLGIGAGAGPQHRRGHRLLRHLAARPGARHGVRADRRRHARRRPVDRRGDPRRHLDGSRGPQHLRVAVAGDRRRGDRQGGRQGRRQGQGDRRGRARGRRRRTSRSPTAGSRSRARPTRGWRSPTSPGSPTSAPCPEGMEPGLEETTFYDPENFVFPFGAHACIVDVDPETGKTTVVRYVAVDDCGNPINPMLIDGQIHGGVAHGIGQALYEQVAYDEEGQLVTGTFVNYALPTAGGVPELRDRPDGDAVAGQLDGRQGRRRGRHDRRLGGRHQRGDRRAPAARRRLHQHAAQPDPGVGGDPGRARARPEANR